MQLEGTVQNGVVVLDSPTSLADGTRVVVILAAETAPAPSLPERLLRLAGTVEDLPPGLGRHHDHPSPGTPRK